MKFCTEIKLKETHLLLKSGIASLAIRVMEIDQTTKMKDPMIREYSRTEIKSRGAHAELVIGREVSNGRTSRTPPAYPRISWSLCSNDIQIKFVGLHLMALSFGKKDQPCAIADSPIALSPGYVDDSDPKENYKDSPVDYLADGGDGDDDDSSDNDEDKEASEEEEEHLAPADSMMSWVTPPSPPAYRTTARISIRPEAPMPFPSKEEVERLLALPPPPPPSPLIPLAPTLAEERLA
ncbi:hypothetical protein Tco_0743835 [Tanacetum coccineum]